MRKLSDMASPLQRLDRMRKSFERDKSVLAEDYKYFTTPDVPVMPREPIPRNIAAHRSVERSGPKSLKRS
jgi:hypothetical protein